MSIAFPNESTRYRAARDRLLEQEIALRKAMEDVAAARRALPPGGELPENYHFEGADGPVRMSALFTPGTDTLVVYSMMFPRDAGDDSPGPTSGRTAELPLAEGPCPSCTGLLDQLDGAAEHVSQHLSFVVVATTSAERLLTWGRERGWRHLRLYSCAGNGYQRAYGGEGDDGQQKPMLNVFERDGGAIRHFWGSELFYAPTEADQDPRHVGTLEPLWNLFDLTRAGRGADWYEQITYTANP